MYNYAVEIHQTVY